ncbi:hypothetical protein CTX76_004210 [Salmonella enterica subsp. houtenae]|uniref:DUF5405 domain-containing protein n=2 Tax=Salmonella enterica TaxID=28901 RepID=A0A5Y3Q5B0_SALER|nr:DUF5405 family protein [Salmonella enterica]EAA3839324.1 hypothetical protein [Salmonella enterica subsp. houtenae]EAN8392410.1 hypothetical protein [Salmonella enterica subsp. arizonae serovar 13,23:gz51:-]EBF3614409.1 hypothetical protein [Salmonella enterica subsp. arizonae serovar [1],13,23:g,z51:-]EBL5973713.1 hypothetical protein [Salmonella enterica subsp. enterica serovar Montevideo]EBP3987527.1 hypothetical protein [Salmonella enterica subsp. enterica]ECB7457119.1 hypothetical pro
MSIRIEIGGRYVVTSDQFQFILQEKKTAKTGKSAGKEWLAVVGYYPKLHQLVSGLIHHDILTGNATSFKALSAQVEQLGQQCLMAFDTNGR